MKERLVSNFLIAIDAVIANKVRSLLTALGIIFGVAAVIAMMAIGNGAREEIMNQIKLVGVNNIVIKPIIEQKEEKIEEKAGKEEKNKFSPGLTVRDVGGIQATIPELNNVSPEIILDTYVIRNGLRRSSKLIGVEPSYFEIYNFELSAGMFLMRNSGSMDFLCVLSDSRLRQNSFPPKMPLVRT
jgi:putative ABC transport system permease protein